MVLVKSTLGFFWEEPLLYINWFLAPMEAASFFVIARAKFCYVSVSWCAMTKKI